MLVSDLVKRLRTKSKVTLTISSTNGHTDVTNIIGCQTYNHCLEVIMVSQYISELWLHRLILFCFRTTFNQAYTPLLFYPGLIIEMFYWASA